MNPANLLLLKNLNNKLNQLHEDNEKIISLLEKITEKDKIIIKREIVIKEKIKQKKSDIYENILWTMF